MSDGPKIEFLDSTWHPPAGGKTTGSKGKLNLGSGGKTGKAGGGSVAASARAKLQRVTSKAPEVMVKVSGRQRGGAHTAAHLEYIGRHGRLEVETHDGEKLDSVLELRELAKEWESDEAASRRRQPLTSVSLVLSMPPGTDPDTVYRAARAFAQTEFERFPYAMALHTDADHPHVHLTVAARGEGGERFNPRKNDLAGWRESFARELRARGVEAEATPRRARGVIQKTERTPVRKIRERAEAGAAELPRVLQSSRAEAKAMLTERPAQPRPWEVKAIVRQSEVRASYERAATVLDASDDPADQKLAQQTRAFVGSMPGLMTRDRELARQMAEMNRAGSEVEKDREAVPAPQRERPMPQREQPAPAATERPTRTPETERPAQQSERSPEPRNTPTRPDRSR